MTRSRLVSRLLQKRQKLGPSGARQALSFLLRRGACQVLARRSGPRLLGGQDDVSRHNLYVLVPELGEGVRGGRVRRPEEALLFPNGGDEGQFADAAQAGRVHEEPGVRARHVIPDLGVEALLRVRVAVVVDAEHDVEELDERTLSVASAPELPPFAFAVSFVVKDAPGQAGRLHVLAAGKERPDLVVEDEGVAALVHPLQERADVLDARLQLPQAFGNDRVVASLDGLEGARHGVEDVAGLGLHGNADEQKPRFGFGAGKGQEGAEIFQLGKVIAFAAKVPKVGAGIGQGRGQLKMSGDAEVRNGD
ncbi:hypothetical protein Trco_003082 [Trichoderma cornu-damae]|uniref:Uncharacterized protein n=1 Tax=Trichoderma cornu-damae TaxID=654480 RepID=A0A9P8QR73_9HYPO|nr:hypothetical protein Trco_003082 [Trichoderma cornu-damae]